MGPYVLVQRQSASVDFDTLTRELAAASAASDPTRALRPDLAAKIGMSGKPQTTFDRVRHRFTTTFQMTTPGGLVRGTTYGFVGKDAVILVHCYDTPAHYAASDPAFQEVVDSVRFDPGHAYADSSRHGPLPVWLFGPIVGGVVGVAVVAVKKLKAS